MIKIYTSENCQYCTLLKNKLKKYDIKYINVNVDLPKNSEEVNKIFEISGEPVIPIIIIKPHILVPKKSFNTIDKAIELIQSLIK